MNCPSVRSRSNVERGHLAQVAHEQTAVDYDRMIPCLPRDGGKPGHLAITLRRGDHQCDVPVLGEYDQVIAGEQDLAISVAAAFPLLLPGCRVEAGENGFVEPIDMTVVQDGARELVLHSRVEPDVPG